MTMRRTMASTMLNTSTDWLDSMDDKDSTGSMDEMVVKSPVRKTRIERVADGLNVSPIRAIPQTMAEDMSYESIYDFDEDVSFDRSRSSRSYSSVKKWCHFSSTMRSTPKASKTRSLRRTRTTRQKSRKEDTNLWDKAIHKNPELKQWINSFNEDMKKIESSELSVIESSLAATE
ncbi:unnamed protein product [Oppiella nova]|uniref:Uncharacterized protein n=1 Tax=Oppiella nova TaxID=334625 RepID=A0A7R9LKB3_9ACAR|nr:unnamed protein product [Oppiella nova]CAG2163823.1 unnamed protein product [Oppiella nova]